MRLKHLENKSVVILGLGKEGMDNLKFLRQKFPDKTIGLADQLELEKFSKEKRKIIKSDKKTKLHLGKSYLKDLSRYDVIIKAPGVPLKKIGPFLTKRQRLISQTEIFFDNCPGIIIGITGTKGKGTTVSLIYKILKQEGLKVRLVGNIGRPVLSFLKSAKEDSIFVYELSSHQLQNLKKSLSIAVFLNLYKAHLDHFKNFQEYKKSKENIALFQKEGDYFIFNKDQKLLRELAQKTKAGKISFGLKLKKLDCSLKNNWIVFKKEKIIKKDQIPLLGEFNLYNVMAAVIIGKLFGVSNKTIRIAIKEFKQLPHRLEYVGRFRKIEFYNDSLATIPEATIAAVDTFKGKLQTIILGGHEAGQNFEELAKKILASNIKNLIFFPPTGKKIWRAILKEKRNKNLKNLKPYFVESMKDAVLIAFNETKGGKVCLLSCASPSFGLFKNYKQRGNLFKKFVRLYGQKKT
jgi:UDP-N-acetylmuramoylalanine--D-glutamate ligase